MNLLTVRAVPRAVHAAQELARAGGWRGLTRGLDDDQGEDTSAATDRPLLPCTTAFELMHEVGWSSRHQYVDVRTAEEFSKSRPLGAVNVPYMLRTAGTAHAASGASAAAGSGLRIPTGGLRMAPNPQFMQQIRAQFEAGTRLIVGSADKSRRARAAATVLEAEGFVHVLTMRGGAKAWAVEELPMESDLGDMS